jgi:hypothetical protein
MKTINEIITALEGKKIKYEYAVSNMDFAGYKLIGINISKDTWAWFEYVDDSDCYLSFKGRYSQNTGKTIKSVMCGIRIRMSLENKLGIKI